MTNFSKLGEFCAKILVLYTAQKMKFSIQDFFSKCDQIRKKLITLHKKMKSSIKGFFSKYDQIHSFLRILSHLLKNSYMENLFSFDLSGKCFLLYKVVALDTFVKSSVEYFLWQPSLLKVHKFINKWL